MSIMMKRVVGWWEALKGDDGALVLILAVGVALAAIIIFWQP